MSQRCEDSFKSKTGPWKHMCWCKKLKQRNDSSKQTKNLSSTLNAGNETKKANAESKSKIITEGRDKRKKHILIQISSDIKS